MKKFVFYTLALLVGVNNNALSQYLGGTGRGDVLVTLSGKYLSNWFFTSGDWGTTTNWRDNTLPTNLETAMIQAAAIVNGDYTVQDLVITSTGSVTVSANKSLTVNGIIDNQASASSIVIKASADGSVANGSLIFQNGTGAPVSATVEMYTKASNASGTYRYQYFGIPLRTMVADWNFGGSWVNEMHENRTPALWELLNNTSTLSSFTGYAITQASPKVISFQGELENSSKSYTCGMLTKSAAGSGSHLIGNPYTAAININPSNGTSLCFGNGMDKTLFLYNTGSYSEWQNGPVAGAPGSYLSVPQNTAGSGGLPATVPSMQAFIVHVTTADGTNTISIPYAAVVRNVNAAKEMQRSAVAPNVSTRINVNGASGGGDCMWVFSEPGCSHGFDNGWDGVKTKGSSSTIQLFARESAGDYQVNTVDDVNNTELAFKASNDTMYTLTFTHENVEMRYSSLYLIDMLTNTTTDITENGSQYVFSATNSSTAETRFRIVVESANPEVVTSNSEITNSCLRIYSSKNKVFVNNPSAVSGQLTLFDKNGKKLQKVPFKAGEISTVQTYLPSGSYVAKATTEMEEVSKRIYLEQ